ncbi:DUF3566 domain-containing protein [Thalassiella azotivora]
MSQSDQAAPGVAARGAGSSRPGDGPKGSAAQGSATQPIERVRPAEKGGAGSPSAAASPSPGRAGADTLDRPATGAAGSGARPGGEARQAPQRPPSAPSGARPGAPRRVRLTVSAVDPWSVMKLSFLLSVAIGVAMVVAAGVLWTLLDGMGVFSDVNGVVGEVLGDPAFDIHDYVGFGKIVSLTTVIAVVDVVLLTAIATLGAFLYNIATSLVGGLHLTLSDE